MQDNWRVYEDDMDYHDQQSSALTEYYMNNFYYDMKNLNKFIFRLQEVEKEKNMEDDTTLLNDPEIEASTSSIKKSVFQNPNLVPTTDEKYKPKQYEIKKLKKKEFTQMMKQIDENRQKVNHSFLTSLRQTKDKIPNLKTVPSVYYLTEKASNLRGKFMQSQDSIEPTPFLEIGDLAHRLIYQDKSLLSLDEHEMIDVRTLGNEVGPVESLELCRILIGIQSTIQSMKESKLEHMLMNKMLRSVSLNLT